VTSPDTPHPLPIAPEAPPELLDRRMVEALRTLGRAPGVLLKAMIDDFLVEAPSLTTDIERAVEWGAPVAAARAAHRLRGTSGHLGLARLAAVAGDVETAARAGAPLVMAAARVRSELVLACAVARSLTAGPERSPSPHPVSAARPT
jgi:two-component system sensor histidine kinase/response regulator